jgi:hypothetical protein
MPYGPGSDGKMRDVATSRLTEKPGGARDVTSWRLNLVRHLPRYPGDLLRKPVYTVELEIGFLTEEAAEEFDAKLRALLPEVKP